MRLHWAVLAAFLAATAASAQPAVAPERDDIRTLIERGTLAQLRHPDFGPLREALDASYRTGAYAPLWLPAGPAPAVLAEIKNAPNNGLKLEDYDAAWLEAELTAITAGDRTPARVATADVALTVSFFRLLSDLNRGRVSPERAGFKLEAPDQALDLPALLRRGVDTGRWRAIVDSVEPQLVLYRRLKDVLVRYRFFASRPLPPLPPLPAGKRKIAPGDTYAGVAALAERLRLVGDLPASVPDPAGDRYEGALVQAVRAFQGRHGLQADGVLGKNTLDQLAVPFSDRVRQIELSLERLRWLPALPASPIIAVNIPSFRLWAFADGGDDTAAQLTMPVIVGGAVTARKTPVFIGEMRYVEFSPYWNVPPAIQRAEIVPHLQRDPGYWEREELEAVPVGSNGPTVTTLDAATLDGLKSGTLRVRQRPGPKNALGAVKFVLPNTMDIYLHSTPAQKLFAQTRRDLSHGCIRVEDPPALAAFVLRDQPAWTPERIAEAMAAGTTTTARLTRPIPVVLFYTTAIVDSTGTVRFSRDIYGYDRRLQELLHVQ
ncbi:MAG TPA: L,D-transpeptidase family protein [Casimicrobiaceae bacterium]